MSRKTSEEASASRVVWEMRRTEQLTQNQEAWKGYLCIVFPKSGTLLSGPHLFVSITASRITPFFSASNFFTKLLGYKQ